MKDYTISWAYTRKTFFFDYSLGGYSHRER
jgi:hypothetical protein